MLKKLHPHITNLKQKLFSTKQRIIISILVFTIVGTGIFGAQSVLADAYESTFTSQVFDNYHSAVNYGTMSWTVDIPANTSLVFSVRAGNVVAPDGSWTGWSVISNSGDSLNAYDGKRYIQYKVVLGTNDQAVTPTVYDVSLTANTSSLDSSVFDSEDAQNIIYAINWSETKPGASDVAFQIRTSANNSTWTSWCGPDNGGSGCETESWFSDPAGTEIIDAMFSDGVDDRYFQYRVILMSDGSNFPTVDDVNVSYGVISFYDLNYAPGPGGTISGNPSQTVMEGADGEEVVAVPDLGYHFVSWDDGVLTASRTDTNVNANITAEASFTINTYALNYTAGNGGTVSGDPSQTINYGADGVEVVAVPDLGYHFVSWDDNVLTEARTDNNVTENISAVANFELDAVPTPTPTPTPEVTPTPTPTPEVTPTPTPTSTPEVTPTPTPEVTPTPTPTPEITPTPETSPTPAPESTSSSDSKKDDSEDLPTPKIRSIEATCNSLKPEVSTQGEYKREKLDFKVKFQNKVTKNEDTLEFKNAKTDKKGRIILDLSPLKRNSQYEIKVKYRESDKNKEKDYSDWSAKKEARTSACQYASDSSKLVIILDPKTSAVNTSPEKLDDQEKEKQEAQRKELANKDSEKIVMPIEKDTNKKEALKKPGLLSSIVYGTTIFKNIIQKNICNLFWLILLIIAILIIWRLREFRKKNKKDN